MLTLANVVWGARCGESARRVLLGETSSSGQAYSVRGARESAALRQAPHRLPSSRLVSTNPFDLWVDVWRKKWAQGDVVVVRYADDNVLGFQHRADADRFLEALRERLRKFGLKLHPEKTRRIEFGRFAKQNRKRKAKFFGVLKNPAQSTPAVLYRGRRERCRRPARPRRTRAGWLVAPAALPRRTGPRPGRRAPQGRALRGRRRSPAPRRRD